jgi:hemerythrin
MDHRRLAWDDSLLMGHPTVDSQHRALVSLIAAVDERETPRDPATLAAALAYAQTHFRDEERLMREACYPDLPAHLVEHKRLTRTLVAYQKAFMAGKGDLYAFKHFMFTWVREHIMRDDMKLGAWLKSQGPSRL